MPNAFLDHFPENLRFVNFAQYLSQLLDKFSIIFNLQFTQSKKTKLLDLESQLNIADCFIFYECEQQMLKFTTHKSIYFLMNSFKSF